jgi:hypothetical protein
MRVAAYLKTGHYHASKKDLAAALAGQDREIILASQDYARWSAGHSGVSILETLMDKCRELMSADF